MPMPSSQLVRMFRISVYNENDIYNLFSRLQKLKSGCKLSFSNHI
uniref:Uncharacterized protein n=1 Tax=Anguilla anguilla TaxID=7936 RepID=A0A0E9XGZ8_ANGAN